VSFAASEEHEGLTPKRGRLGECGHDVLFANAAANRIRAGGQAFDSAPSVGLSLETSVSITSAMRKTATRTATGPSFLIGARGLVVPGHDLGHGIGQAPLGQNMPAQHRMIVAQEFALLKVEFVGNTSGGR